MLEIKCGPEEEIIKVDSMWLRDHCRCAKCFNATGQRTFNLPKDLKAKELTYSKNGTILEVVWHDGHVSEYDIDFIVSSQYGKLLLKVTNDKTKTLWNVPSILKNKDSTEFKLGEISTSDNVVKDLMTSLIRYGVVCIHDVPANMTMTEMAVRRLFPVMKSLFGEMLSFSDVYLFDDITFAKDYIGPHTDNTYLCDAAGLQALHCTEHDGEGGANFFIDGFYCAEELRRKNPKAFDILSSVQVPAEFIDKRSAPTEYHSFSSPIIRVDPVTNAIFQIRLNLYDRSTLNTIPQQQMRGFYESLSEFLDIIHESENLWRLKMTPGTVVIFDNWRLLHGRDPYTGKRNMTGCFVQRTDFLSKARTLGIID